MIPSLIHQTESRERRPSAMEAKGVPLSVRMRPGRPNFAEETSEDAPRARVGRAIEALAGEQIAAEAVLDGEWVAVAAIEGLELALEVGGPDRIRRIKGRSGRPTGMWAPSASAGLVNESLTPEVLVKDASGGDAPVGMQSQEPSPDLVGTPASATSTELEGGLEHMQLARVWMCARTMGVIREAVGPLDLISLEPLVACLPADAVAKAELGVREDSSRGPEDESFAFVHRIGLQPWHGASL